LILAFALFLTVLPYQVSARSPGYATIELRGSKSAHVDVRFDEPIKITCCGDTASADEKFDVPPLTVRTRGAFAGYLVERLSDGKIVAGAVRVPAMDWASFDFRWTVLVRESRGWLEPGSYRIHHVTDDESTVRFRVEGLDEDASYQPKIPTRVRSSLKTPLVESGQPVSHHSTPVRVDEDTLVIVASLLVAERNQVSYLEHCVVRLVEPCQSRRDHSGAISISPVDNIESLSGIYSVYRAGHFEPGDWQAKFSAASAGVVRRAQTLVLTID
jgi:hypothetical protein